MPICRRKSGSQSNRLHLIRPLYTHRSHFAHAHGIEPSKSHIGSCSRSTATNAIRPLAPWIIGPRYPSDPTTLGPSSSDQNGRSRDP